MQNTRLDDSQDKIKIAGEISTTTTLMAESEEEQKSLLMIVKRGKWKTWLET